MHGASALRYLGGMTRPLRVLALAGVVVVFAIAAVVMHRSFEMPLRGSAPELAAPPAADTAAPPGDVVGQALDLATPDSTLLKKRWVDDIPDLDLAALAPAARGVFLRIANGRACGCGCGYTLAGCRRYDPSCDVSGPRAQALYDSVASGRIARADGFPEPPATR